MQTSYPSYIIMQICEIFWFVKKYRPYLFVDISVLQVWLCLSLTVPVMGIIFTLFLTTDFKIRSIPPIKSLCKTKNGIFRIYGAFFCQGRHVIHVELLWVKGEKLLKAKWAILGLPSTDRKILAVCFCFLLRLFCVVLVCHNY